MKKKIIFFLSPEVTGAERVSITMAKQLNQEEYDVSFAIIGESSGKIVRFVPKRYPITVTSLEHLEEYIQVEHPNQVFCSLIHLNAEVLKAARQDNNIKVILRNNLNLRDVCSDLIEKAKYAYPKADLVIAQTEQMKQELIRECGVSEDKMEVIDNPIDKEYIDEMLTDASSPYPKDGRNHFCWVGRYDYIKGVDILIEAFSSAIQKKSCLSLYMVGSVEEENRFYQCIQEMVKTNHLQDIVHFIGFEENPYKWMKYADGLIIPSRSEANSNVQKEARFLGTPVVFSNNPSEIAKQMIK